MIKITELGKCCNDMNEVIEKGIFFIKNNEILLGTNIKPIKTYNIETNEEYDPNSFLIAFSLNYCPFCASNLREDVNKMILNRLNKRNMRRIKHLKKIHKAYCPAREKFIIPTHCTFCQFGHMLECHYPYDCNSPYCKHYHNEEYF